MKTGSFQLIAHISIEMDLSQKCGGVVALFLLFYRGTFSVQKESI
jgi:hypothetical protein